MNGQNQEPQVRRPGTPATGLFREDALRHHLGRRDFGDVLRLPPAWTRLAFPLILLFAAAALAFLFLATVERREPPFGRERLIHALVPGLKNRIGG